MDRLRRLWPPLLIAAALGRAWAPGARHDLSFAALGRQQAGLAALGWQHWRARHG